MIAKLTWLLRFLFPSPEAFAKRWGAVGIFFTRWLITSLGPWLNLTSGMTGYPWPWFFLWGVLGEVLWVVGLIAAVLLGWKLLRYLQPASDIKV